MILCNHIIKIVFRWILYEKSYEMDFFLYFLKNIDTSKYRSQPFA